MYPHKYAVQGRGMQRHLQGLTCVLLLAAGNVMAQAEQPPPAPSTIQIVAPTEGGVLLGRRPEIRASYTGSLPAEILVTLDGTDITPLLERSASGFAYHPPKSLAAGSHQLTVTTKGADGTEAQSVVSFSSRHGETILEASSQNELGYVYDLAVARHQYPATQPTQKLEGTLRTDSRIKTDHWQLGFNGTLRHIDQNTPLTAPLERGVDATTWLLSLGYTRDLASAEARFGDVQVNETSYTVANLARRGGDVTLAYDRLRLHAFNVSGQQLFGLRGGDRHQWGYGPACERRCRQRQVPGRSGGGEGRCRHRRRSGPLLQPGDPGRREEGERGRRPAHHRFLPGETPQRSGDGLDPFRRRPLRPG